MKDLNKVLLIGRATRDASLGYAGQTAKLEISIAVNTTKKNGDQYNDEPNYFDVVIFGKMAETLKPLITKGKQCAIEGILKQGRWEKDGEKKSKVYILADAVQLLGSTKSGDPNAPKFSAAAQEVAQEFGGEVAEDIPF